MYKNEIIDYMNGYVKYNNLHLKAIETLDGDQLLEQLKKDCCLENMNEDLKEEYYRTIRTLQDETGRVLDKATYELEVIVDKYQEVFERMGVIPDIGYSLSKDMEIQSYVEPTMGNYDKEIQEFQERIVRYIELED